MQAQSGTGPSVQRWPAAVDVPPERRRRLSRRVRWVVGVVLVLALLGGGGLAARNTGPDGRVAVAASGSGAAMELPWPDDGQASVAVPGIGSLGTSGEQKPVPIASVAKVMTAYVVLREHPLRQGESGPRITVDQRAEDESHSLDESTVRVRAGQELTQRQLLELLLLPSGNNAARLLARWDSGTERAFVEKMNHAAADLGMGRTTYTGASGFEATTTSTAADQLRLARAVMRDEVFRSVVATPEVTVGDVTGTVANTNRLLGTSGVVGLKTGSSTPAGGALMWAAETGDGHGKGLIIGVVLHQRANTTPAEGLRAAFESSRELITAAQRELGEARAVRRA
ncbi:D-alanyl-D-alanine carboxypeptidase family protein [Streptomyces sp. NPDC020141]|uniref:D-alanyl-D-alanine carboxypeptidase family protein n=1 Tax=Streptomyces sp. NPDC020141 TaxID=3365065 RepID=UPI00378E2C10